MWVPYAILAVASIAIGVIGFVFEAELHHLFSEYLAESLVSTVPKRILRNSNHARRR